MQNATVIVLTANRLTQLRLCLASLEAQTLPPMQVVVVENGSRDGTRKWLRSLELRSAAGPIELAVVERRGEGSFAAARNAGIAEATGDWVAFLDDDCEADRFWLERLVATADAQGLHAVGGAVLPADQLPTPEHHPPENSWAAGLLPEAFFGREGGRRILPTTSSLMALRDLFEAHPFQEVGGRLDGSAAKGYLYGREDAEWWRRLRRAGVPVGLAPRAIAWHHVTAERLEDIALQDRAEADGRAAWLREQNPAQLRGAARDILHLPLALATDLVSSPHPLPEVWRRHRLWFRRQSGLLSESVSGTAPVHPTVRFNAFAREVPGAAAAIGKAAIRTLASSTIPLLQPMRARDLAEDPPGRLAVVLHDLLGDTVLAIPALRQLIAGCKGTTDVVILCGPVGFPILKAALEGARIRRIPPAASGTGPVAAARLLQFLASHQPEAILVMYAHGLSPAPLFALGVPVVSWTHDNGFRQRMWGDLVTHPVAKSQRKFEVAALLDLLAPFGIRARLERPAFEPPASAEERTARILEQTMLSPDEYAVVHYESAPRYKIWPRDRTEEVVTRLVDTGFSVFLVGSKASRPAARSLARKLGPACESLNGVLDSGELASLIKAARVFFGSDSGPGHVAQAVGTDTFLVFGATEPWRWGPLPPLPGEEVPRLCLFAASPGDWVGEELEGLSGNHPMELSNVDSVWDTLVSFLAGEENFPPAEESH